MSFVISFHRIFWRYGGYLVISWTFCCILIISYGFFAGILPYYFPTKLVAKFLLSIIFLYLTLQVCFHYLCCVYISPGTYSTATHIWMQTQETLDRSRMKFCDRCNRIQPPRAFHCSIHQECVLMMDHHCPWVDNCIGFYNYPLLLLLVTDYFVLFLLYLSIYCWFVALMSMELYFFMPKEFPSLIQRSLNFSFMLAVGIGVLATGLLGFQVYLLGTEQTTNEYLTFAASRAPSGVNWRYQLQLVFGTRWQTWFCPVFYHRSDDSYHFLTSSSSLHV